MDFPYVAFTGACTFGLDEKGVCRDVKGSSDATEADLAIARRCLGAQYVASLDGAVEGFLTHRPKPGTRLLFARAEEDGRIVLVRSGPLTLFITREDDEQPLPEKTIDTSLPSEANIDDEGMTAPFTRKHVHPGAGGLELEAVEAVTTRRVPDPPDSEPVTTRRSPVPSSGLVPAAAPVTVRGLASSPALRARA